MDTSPKYDLPWELISGSFTGTLSGDEKLLLEQWLTANPANKDKYSKLEELWNNGLEEYSIYKMANGYKAWEALQSKLGKPETINPETKVIKGRFTQMSIHLKYLTGIAAVFLGLVVLWVISNQNNTVIYETASGIQKKVILEDGSSIILSPHTHIEVSHEYNKTNRSLRMESGEAYFEVEHLTAKPFIVLLGTTQIEDIGTSFMIKKDKKEINVTVTSGKVIFAKVSSQESRELDAGANITFDIQSESFGELKYIKSPSKTDAPLLKFENTPLSDVIISIQKVYGKKIKLGDALIANKKFTAQLDGMSYNKAMQVICKSLGLEYSVSDSVYILKEKKTEQP